MQMEGSYVTTVVITGFVVVFIGLVLLILLVTGLGKIFEAIETKKTSAAANAEPIKTTAVQTPAPQIEDGISDETVAVIAAAVAAMSPDYKLAGIKKASQKTSRRTAWGNKGLSESTSIF